MGSSRQMEVVDANIGLAEAWTALMIFEEMVRLDVQAVWIGSEWAGYYDRRTGHHVQTILPPLNGDHLYEVGDYDQQFRQRNPQDDGFLKVLNDL